MVGSRSALARGLAPRPAKERTKRADRTASTAPKLGLIVDLGDEPGTTTSNGCVLPLGAIIVVAVVEGLGWPRPDLIPFELFEFWGFHGTLWDILNASWPVFAVGLALNLLSGLYRLGSLPSPGSAAELVENLVQEPLVRGFALLRSLLAAVFEEIVYRWLYFYSAIVTLTALNYLLFESFGGPGMLEWLYGEALIPAADWLTFGKLHEVLVDSTPWAVGAAMLSANGRFRNGHSYQGWVGWIWSWFGGMFLFLMMFRHGLVAAILVHAGYNLLAWAVFGVFTKLVARRRLIYGA